VEALNILFSITEIKCNAFYLHLIIGMLWTSCEKTRLERCAPMFIQYLVNL